RMVPAPRMGRVGAETDVGYEIAVWQCRHAPVGPDRVRPTIGPRSVSIVMGRVEDITPITNIVWIAQHFFQPPVGPQVGPTRHSVIKQIPCTAPRGPTPDVGMSGKIVTGVTHGAAKLEVVSRNHHHPAL